MRTTWKGPIEVPSGSLPLYGFSLAVSTVLITRGGALEGESVYRCHNGDGVTSPK